MVKWIRKLYRMLGLVFPVTYLAFGRHVPLILLGIVIAIFAVIEILRFANRNINKTLFRKLHFLMKEKERNKVSTSTLFVFANLVVIWFFEPHIAVPALFFLTLGDTAAEVIGEKFGKHRFSSGKSIEGSTANLAACLLTGLVLMQFIPLFTVQLLIVGSIAATLTELLLTFVDDNLSVPVVTAAALWAAESIL